MGRAVLGFNANIHDTAAALLVDGQLTAFVEEERLRREKHTTAFPDRAIAWCLREHGLTARDLAGVGFYWRPWVGLARRIGQTLRGLPATWENVRRLQGGNLRGMFATAGDFRRRYGYAGPFRYVNHYLAHAYHAAWQTDFDRALIVVVDGNGEIATTLIALLEGETIRPLRWIFYPHSLGLLWCTTTEWLGYRQNFDEGKVMGLAPCGDASALPAMRRIVAYCGSGEFRLDMSYFDYQLARRNWYGERWIEAFGPPRRSGGELTDRHRAVAFAVQKITEETMARLVEEMTRKLGTRNLVLAGGVALNCVMNGALAASGLVDGLYVPPPAHDAGAAIGAAMWVDREVFGARGRDVAPSVFCGPRYTDDQCERALREAGLTYRREENIGRATAKLLAAGKFVGRFAGALEAGPRALGHRSILADPRTVAMKDRLNARVKHREAYRPFGPSVLVERADELFVTGGRPSPHMLLTFPVRPAWCDRLGAVTHVDGTSRLQTVDRNEQPGYAALIDEFAALTGVPAVLNTSFNAKDEPIVCSPRDAIRSFLCTGLDALALHDFLVLKK